MKAPMIIVAAVLISACGSIPEKPPAPEGKPRPINSDATERMLIQDAGYLAVKGRPSPDTFEHEGVELRTRSAEGIRQFNRNPTPNSRSLLPGQVLVPNTVSVQFAFDDATFKPSPDQQFRMRQLLAVADRVEVMGRTDGHGDPRADEIIAMERAKAAKRYLIGRGMPGTEISINYVAAGDYVGDNGTVEGRRLNRRVDIKFIVKDFARGEQS